MELRSLAVACVLLMSMHAQAQISNNVVRIGVLSDMSGIFATASGPGSVVAARMAVEDFGASVRGAPIEIVSADHQNKPDVGSTIVRKWFDTEDVDAVADIPVSSIALAAQEIAREKRRTLLISGGSSSDLYGKACSPYSVQWADDTYALSSGTVKAVMQGGGDSWYFITVDFAFGHALERDAMRSVGQGGGKVIGSVRHPIGTLDLASFLLRAQSSGAKVVGLANVGSDTANSVKQARQFGVQQSQSLVAFLMFLTDIEGLGLADAQGLYILDGFYWDQNEASRKWSSRFLKRHGKMPTKDHAATYAAVVHYLRAIDAAGTDSADVVNAQMRKMPIDYFGRSGSIRADGRVIYDLTLYQIKSPKESEYAWDFQKEIRTIAAAEAFRPEGEGGCPLASQR